MENETNTNKIDLSTEALQRRREIAEKATPGPWEILCNHLVEANGKRGKRAIAWACSESERNWQRDRDADFIAANSPNAVIAMITEIERLRQENDKNELVIANMDIEAWKDIHLEIMRKKLFKLEKENKWLAEHCEGKDQCPYLAFQWGDPPDNKRPDWCICTDTPEDGFDCEEYPVDCWLKVAQEAIANERVANGAA